VDLGPTSQLAHYAAIFLVDQDDLTSLACAVNVTLAGPVLLWVISLDAGGGLVVLGRLRTLQKGGALRQDGLERVDVFLRHRRGALANGWKLNPGEGAALGPQVPAWDQVAARRLVVDLGRCREREIELRREVEVQIEVFFGRLVLAAGVAEVGERRTGGDHQQRQRLRARGRERRLFALLDVEGLDASHRVEQSGIAAATHDGGSRTRGVSGQWTSWLRASKRG